MFVVHEALSSPTLPLITDHLIPVDATWYAVLSVLIVAAWAALLVRRLWITVQRFRFIRGAITGVGVKARADNAPRVVLGANGNLLRLPSADTLRKLGLANAPRVSP